MIERIFNASGCGKYSFADSGSREVLIPISQDLRAMGDHFIDNSVPV